MLKEFILTYLPKDELIVLSNVCHLVWAKSLKKSLTYTPQRLPKNLIYLVYAYQRKL